MRDNERVVFLEGERIYMRRIESEDLKNAQRWVNNPEIRKYLGAVFPFDAIEEENWHANRPRGPFACDLVFAIRLKEGDVHIGNMGVHGIDWVNRFATTGTVIGEKEYWGKGYAHEAKMLLLEYLFNSLGLNRVQSVVLAPNERSRKCLAKSGYKEEGVHRHKYFRDGEWIDEISLAVMADDWRQLKATLD